MLLLSPFLFPSKNVISALYVVAVKFSNPDLLNEMRLTAFEAASSCMILLETSTVSEILTPLYQVPLRKDTMQSGHTSSCMHNHIHKVENKQARESVAHNPTQKVVFFFLYTKI